ncbi:hypothetical protein D3C81_1824350 [compost metagenome]
MQGDTGALVQLRLAEGQRFGIAAGEVFGEMHAVVGAQRLFAEHMDAVAIQRAALDQLLDAVVADHAVADDDQRLHISEGSVHWEHPANPVPENKKGAWNLAVPGAFACSFVSAAGQRCLVHLYVCPGLGSPLIGRA